MKHTIPEVFLIARPQPIISEMRTYLDKVNGVSWLDRAMNAVEADKGMVNEHVIEFAGRMCYRSWEPGLNANVTKVRTDQKEYFTNLLASGHGSVLEHGMFTFVFHNVSRVFTHELVRHRAGTAISQESLRYVRLTDLSFRVPDVLKPLEYSVVSIVEHLEEFQVHAADTLGLNDDNVPFHVKKEVTSALRRLAPLGLSTGMVWSANSRTLRHVVESRTAAGAEEEIRLVFDQVGKIMQVESPNLFADYEINEEGAWVTPYQKV